MTRAREVGINLPGLTGEANAITDVSGVQVGYATVIEGDDVRTGVTVIMPARPGVEIFAGFHRLNGNGEMTGMHYVEEMGTLGSPIAITNSHSVGTVHEALVRHAVRAGHVSGPFTAWSLTVVAETWDGRLNDINGFHVRPKHVEQALADLRGGVIAEGNVGGGTGMVCHGFKGGTGTASRVVNEVAGAEYTVGVLVQANHGRRHRLRVNGVPVGEQIPTSEIPVPTEGGDGGGSIIVVVATNAPLLPTQCKRLAQRAALGIGRMGGLGENSSGDLCLAFSTANALSTETTRDHVTHPVEMVRNERLDPLFEAVVDATEEAILNALLTAETMTGYRNVTAYALDPVRLLEIMAHRPSSSL